MEENRVTERRPESELGPADWVVAGVRAFGAGVGSLVPVGFEAYARVFHPAGAPTGDDVSWASVAEACKTVFHPGAEWGSLVGGWNRAENHDHEQLWVDEPESGSLPPRQAEGLSRVLANFTSTPEQCWFALWEGWSDLPPSWDSAPRVAMPQRPMLLFAAPLRAAAESLADSAWFRSASLWWPQDRVWCVATDVDLMTTYVGGSRACIDAIRSDDRLEALEVSVEQQVTWKTDTVNPLPESP